MASEPSYLISYRHIESAVNQRHLRGSAVRNGLWLCFWCCSCLELKASSQSLEAEFRLLFTIFL